VAGRRWDGDERGEGIADARSLAPAVKELLGAMQRPDWVAEQPEVHLLPHLRRSCESLPVDLVDARVAEDGCYEVELRWTGEPGRIGAVRAVAFALVGGFAEGSTAVRQRRGDGGGDGDDVLRFEVVTGFVDGESRFVPHGHTVRLRIVGVVGR
jgi:hypothetical protein